jgi:hypothetical protein
MSRRRRGHADADVDDVFSMLRWHCFCCGAELGRIVYQGPDNATPGYGINVDAGPDGQRKARARCQACVGIGHTHDPQVRWDTLVDMLQDMRVRGEVERDIAPA